MVKKKKGAALVIVLMVLVVLSIFAVTFIDVNFNEQKQIIRVDKKTKAYYIARAGAESTANYIINNHKKAAALKSAGKSNPVSFGAGNFTVQVNEKADGTLSIESEGIVNNVKNSVVMNLNKLKATDIFKGSIASKGNLNVTGMKTVTGDLESTDGTVIAPYDYTYSVVSESHNVYNEPDLPTGLTAQGSINTKNDGPTIINSDGQYTNITAWQKDLTFEPNGHQLKIVVDNFTVEYQIQYSSSSKIWSFV